MDEQNLSQIPQAISELPWAGLIPVGLTLLVGLLLWATGRRSVRFVFAAAGFLVGSMLGWVLTTGLALPIHPWLGATAAGTLAALIGVIAWRLAVAAALAAMLALACPLVVRTVASLGGADLVVAGGTDSDTAEPDAAPPDEPAEDLSPELSEFLDEARARTEPQTEAVRGQFEKLRENLRLDEQTQEQVEHVRGVAGSLIAALRQAWDQSPPRLQLSMVVAAAIGALLGLLLAALTPKLSTAFVTSVGGALIVLSSGWVLATRLGVPQGPWLPTTPASWLLWWSAFAVIGLAVQWTLRRKPADKTA